MTNLLVGFLGYAQVGKDTAAIELGWPRTAFAKELKSDLGPIIDKLGFDLVFDKAVLRRLYVEYGRLGRVVAPDYWIKRMALSYPKCAICDVRYLNEVRWIMDRGGMVIRINRPGYFQANVEEARSFAEIHDNEDALAKPIFSVENDSTIAALGNRVRAIVGSARMWAAVNDKCPSTNAG